MFDLAQQIEKHSQSAHWAGEIEIATVMLPSDCQLLLEGLGLCGAVKLP